MDETNVIGNAVAKKSRHGLAEQSHLNRYIPLRRLRHHTVSLESSQHFLLLFWIRVPQFHRRSEALDRAARKRVPCFGQPLKTIESDQMDRFGHTLGEIEKRASVVTSKFQNRSVVA